MLFLKNIVALKNFDTTVKCHFGRISDTKMFFIRENHIFHTGLHLPDNVLSSFSGPVMGGKTSLELVEVVVMAPFWILVETVTVPTQFSITFFFPMMIIYLLVSNPLL